MKSGGAGIVKSEEGWNCEDWRGAGIVKYGGGLEL